MCNHSPAWFHRGTEEIQEGNHMSIFKWLEGPQLKQYILSLLAGKGYCFQTEYPIFDLYPPYTFGVSKFGIPKTSPKPWCFPFNIAHLDDFGSPMT